MTFSTQHIVLISLQTVLQALKLLFRRNQSTTMSLISTSVMPIQKSKEAIQYREVSP